MLSIHGAATLWISAGQGAVNQAEKCQPLFLADAQSCWCTACLFSASSHKVFTVWQVSDDFLLFPPAESLIILFLCFQPAVLLTLQAHLCGPSLFLPSCLSKSLTSILKWDWQQQLISVKTEPWVTEMVPVVPFVFTVSKHTGSISAPRLPLMVCIPCGHISKWKVSAQPSYAWGLQAHPKRERELFPPSCGT